MKISHNFQNIHIHWAEEQIPLVNAYTFGIHGIVYCSKAYHQRCYKTLRSEPTEFDTMTVNVKESFPRLPWVDQEFLYS